MKQYWWKFKVNFFKTGFQFDYWQSEKILNTNKYFHYFLIALMDAEDRKFWREEKKENPGGAGLFGLHKHWYDCPHAQLNLYFICIGWSSPWTTYQDPYYKRN